MSITRRRRRVLLAEGETPLLELGKRDAFCGEHLRQLWPCELRCVTEDADLVIDGELLRRLVFGHAAEATCFAKPLRERSLTNASLLRELIGADGRDTSHALDHFLFVRRRVSLRGPLHAAAAVSPLRFRSRRQ